MSQMIPACLPPRDVSRPKLPPPPNACDTPDAGHLFELFQTWTPDLSTRHRILVTNPATLYGFSN